MLLGDRYYSAFLFEKVAVLATDLGRFEQALELAGAADRLRDEIGAGRAPALVEELARELEPARHALEVERAAQAEAHGRTLGFEGAAGLALTICAS